MRLSIRSRKFELTPSLERYAERRVGSLADRFRDRVRSIEVRMTDVNGPKGGVDKKCSVHIRGPHRLNVTIDERDADMYAAIDRALGRAKRSLIRQLDKRGDVREHGSSRFTEPSMA